MKPDIRAVVLGWQISDKAAVMNSLLCDAVKFDQLFVKSYKKDGEVNGRKITLINTPCWWKIFFVEDAPEVVKQELVCSVFECPPGPHVFLLVINLTFPFTEENRLSIEEHLGLFGEKIWRHTIVVITQTDSNKTIENYIQNQEDLRQIITKCGERYHICDFKNKSVAVEELLVKIDDVVAANSGKHYETNDDMLQEIRRKRDTNKEKAKDRQKMLQDRRNLLKEITVAPLSELRIILLGWIMSGKSSTGNTIFSHEVFQRGAAKTCTAHTDVVNGRSITVLDTPSWFKYFSSKFNPKFTQAAILESIIQSQHMQFPHAMVLVIPVDTSFKNEQKRVIEEHMALLGEDVWRHTIVLFSWGDRFPDNLIERHIESEGDALQWLIEKCRNRYHVFDNANIKNRTQVTELFQKIDEMVAENSVLHLLNSQCLNIPETDTHEEMSLDADYVEKLLHQEMNDRIKGIARKVRQMGREIDVTGCVEVESHHSMSNPPGLSADENLKEKIRREGSRWEVIIMDHLLKSLNPGASSDDDTSLCSNEKVRNWLKSYDVCTDSGVKRVLSELEDSRDIKRHKIQLTE